MEQDTWSLGSVLHDNNTTRSVACKSDNHRSSFSCSFSCASPLVSSYNNSADGNWHLCTGRRAPMIECTSVSTVSGLPEL